MFERTAETVAFRIVEMFPASTAGSGQTVVRFVVSVGAGLEASEIPGELCVGQEQLKVSETVSIASLASTGGTDADGELERVGLVAVLRRLGADPGTFHRPIVS